MKKLFSWACVIVWMALSVWAQTTTTAAKKKTSSTPKKPATSAKSTSGKTSTPAAKKTSTAKKSATPAKSAAPSGAAPSKAPAKKSSSKKKGSASKTAAGKRAPKTTWRNRQTVPTQARYKQIQDALAAKGFLTPEEATGQWGAESVDAMKRFQAAQRIDATGKINSLSLIALGLGPTREAAPKPPDASPQQAR